uniref:Integrase catalytic domain-containing protein n=1 Tax=Romanomermis culicivorax TaxID=13658 RepID=A0A915L035_ROMCU
MTAVRMLLVPTHLSPRAVPITSPAIKAIDIVEMLHPVNDDVSIMEQSQTTTEVAKLLPNIGVDCIGPMTTRKAGNHFIVVFIDYFTKWVEALATLDITAQTGIQTIRP